MGVVNKMRIKWSTLLFNLSIWLALEITLTCLGFDDLADYSEFILENKKTYIARIDNTHSSLARQHALTSNIPCFFAPCSN